MFVKAAWSKYYLFLKVLHVNVKENALGAFITEVNSVTNRRRLAWSVLGGEEVRNIS